MKHLIFTGDSYTSAWAAAPQQDQYQTPGPGHPGLVAAQLGDQLHCHGYSAHSWWYSWSQLQLELDHDRRLVDPQHNRACEWFHTNASRVNSCNAAVEEGLHPNNFHYRKQPTAEDQARAACYSDMIRWNFLDTQFQLWAQQQYFYMIARELAQLRHIHFVCFEDTVDSAVRILPGRVFTTPLYEGITQREPESADRGLWNHMNAHNNQALAQVIQAAIQHYQPGAGPIDTRGFDII